MSMKINKLEIENVKRVRAVKMEPTSNGLTIIGGNNSEGKTSVLDAIAWALGGNNYRPSEPMRRGSATAPYLKVTMSNGLVVERKGKNSDLKVTDPSGQRAGQQLLDTFIEKLALDLPKFMQASDKDKAAILLNIIGVGPQLAELEIQEKQKYQERLMIGRIADQKKKFAAEQPYYPDAPSEIVSAADLIKQQQDMLLRNAEKAKIRRNAAEAEGKLSIAENALKQAQTAVAEAMTRLDNLTKEYEEAERVYKIAHESAEAVTADESTEQLERDIEQVEEINRQVRANLDKEKAEDDAREYIKSYDMLTTEIEGIRKAKTDLLDGAGLPLPELTIEDSKLMYKGQQWDNMSGAEQLIVATSIVRKLNPECGFVLIDKLEQMDNVTLQRFGKWLEHEGLQVIATRVSTGEECSIIITDGYGEMTAAAKTPAPAAWKKGEF